MSQCILTEVYETHKTGTLLGPGADLFRGIYLGISDMGDGVVDRFLRSSKF